jgi:hypothetical protein
VNAETGNLRRDGYQQLVTLLTYVTSVHLKGQVSAPDGSKEPADWARLPGILGNAGYRVMLGCEGTEAETEVPRMAAELRTVVRKLSV